MALLFDGDSRTIILTAGTVTLSVADLWSRWVDWFATNDNSKYPVAMSQTGGDDIDPASGTTIPAYIFLLNGWRIRPQESSHTLNVFGGILLVDGGGDPFVDTIGAYSIRINYSQPVQAITVSTSGGGGGAGVTAEAVRDAVWSATLNNYHVSSAAGVVRTLPSVDAIANAVWDEDIAPHSASGSSGAMLQQINANASSVAITVMSVAEMVSTLLKYDRNRTKIDTTTMRLTIYDDDGVTPIRVFSLRDRTGQPSIVESMERIPVV